MPLVNCDAVRNIWDVPVTDDEFIPNSVVETTSKSRKRHHLAHSGDPSPLSAGSLKRVRRRAREDESSRDKSSGHESSGDKSSGDKSSEDESSEDESSEDEDSQSTSDEAAIPDPHRISHVLEGQAIWKHRVTAINPFKIQFGAEGSCIIYHKYRDERNMTNRHIPEIQEIYRPEYKHFKAKFNILCDIIGYNDRGISASFSALLKKSLSNLLGATLLAKLKKNGEIVPRGQRLLFTTSTALWLDDRWTPDQGNRAGTRPTDENPARETVVETAKRLMGYFCALHTLDPQAAASAFNLAAASACTEQQENDSGSD